MKAGIAVSYNLTELQAGDTGLGAIGAGGADSGRASAEGVLRVSHGN